MPTLETSTLDSLGAVLPYGLAEGGALHRSFVLRRPTMGLQRAVGALRTDPSVAKRPGALYLRFLGLVVESIGSIDIGALKQGPADELLGRLTVGDVLFLGYAWQRACSPRGVPLGAIDCGGCGTSLGDVAIDVGTLEVTHLPLDAGPSWLTLPVVVLDDPIPLPAGRRVVAVRLRPPPWSQAYGRLTAEAYRNPAAVQARAIVASIAEAQLDDGTTIPGLTDAAVDELLPSDVRAIDSALGDITPTLDLTVEVECPACGRVNRDTLDWRAEGFSKPS